MSKKNAIRQERRHHERKASKYVRAVELQGAALGEAKGNGTVHSNAETEMAKQLTGYRKVSVSRAVHTHAGNLIDAIRRKNGWCKEGHTTKNATIIQHSNKK